MFVPQSGDGVLPVGLLTTKESVHEPAVADVSVTKLLKSNLKKQTKRNIVRSVFFFHQKTSERDEGTKRHRNRVTERQTDIERQRD